jgi:hypothetical protein
LLPLVAREFLTAPGRVAAVVPFGNALAFVGTRLSRFAFDRRLAAFARTQRRAEGHALKRMASDFAHVLAQL